MNINFRDIYGHLVTLSLPSESTVSLACKQLSQKLEISENQLFLVCPNEKQNFYSNTDSMQNLLKENPEYFIFTECFKMNKVDFNQDNLVPKTASSQIVLSFYGSNQYCTNRKSDISTKVLQHDCYQNRSKRFSSLKKIPPRFLNNLSKIRCYNVSKNPIYLQYSKCLRMEPDDLQQKIDEIAVLGFGIEDIKEALRNSEYNVVFAINSLVSRNTNERKPDYRSTLNKYSYFTFGQRSNFSSNNNSQIGNISSNNGNFYNFYFKPRTTGFNNNNNNNSSDDKSEIDFNTNSNNNKDSNDGINTNKSNNSSYNSSCWGKSSVRSSNYSYKFNFNSGFSSNYFSSQNHSNKNDDNKTGSNNKSFVSWGSKKTDDNSIIQKNNQNDVNSIKSNQKNNDNEPNNKKQKNVWGKPYASNSFTHFNSNNNSFAQTNNNNSNSSNNNAWGTWSSVSSKNTNSETLIFGSSFNSKPQFNFSNTPQESQNTTSYESTPNSNFGQNSQFNNNSNPSKT